MTTALLKKPHEYSFFQAVRLLAGSERQLRRELEVLDETIEFRSDSGGQFPSSEVREISKLDGKHNVVVNNFGIAGPLGPLPEAHSDWINSENLRGRHRLSRFLALFNHRLVALRYLIRKRCSSALHSGPPEDTEVYRYLKDIGSLEKPQSGPAADTELSSYAGLLAGERASSARIESIVSAYLNTPVKLRSFIGAFVPVDKDQRTALSRRRAAYSVLGKGRVIGKTVWRQDYAIELCVGPIDFQTAAELQPERPRFDPLRRLLLHVTDGRWVIHVDFLVRSETIPQSGFVGSELGSDLTLGHSGWVKTASSPDDAGLVTTRCTIKPFSVH